MCFACSGVNYGLDMLGPEVVSQSTQVESIACSTVESTLSSDPTPSVPQNKLDTGPGAHPFH